MLKHSGFNKVYILNYKIKRKITNKKIPNNDPNERRLLGGVCGAPRYEV
jgi:hypothetical protein